MPGRDIPVCSTKVCENRLKTVAEKAVTSTSLFKEGTLIGQVVEKNFKIYGEFAVFPRTASIF